jgi:microcystin-dependent protein
MTEPFIGQIQPFGFNFNPRGWAFCNGATLPIQQNTALFALLGTQYGGNGQTTFQLPNLAGRAAAQQGTGPGLSARSIGQSFGVNTVTLTTQEMPGHSHAVTYYAQTDTSKRTSTPASNVALSVPTSSEVFPFVGAGSPVNTQFAPTMLQPSGGGQPHANQQPYLAVNFCIALQGIFPSFP